MFLAESNLHELSFFVHSTAEAQALQYWEGWPHISSPCFWKGLFMFINLLFFGIEFLLKIFSLSFRRKSKSLGGMKETNPYNKIYTWWHKLGNFLPSQQMALHRGASKPLSRLPSVDFTWAEKPLQLYAFSSRSNNTGGVMDSHAGCHFQFPESNITKTPLDCKTMVTR